MSESRKPLRFSNETDLYNDIEEVIELKNISLSPSVNLQYEQLEGLVERVLKNILHGKIEEMLAEVIEEVVTKEINQLKSILLETIGDN
ncbi:hypothetical protein BuS5_02867 [Desulfosarcina sp. BuS5]|uniref:hypothetical protein n=1 Tax=Desulfosarcina sp. BuS5 TaxID=933262 RepID=UPI00048054AC|nr:hypothetical protein [Desulfosarcina sp. BuS5]WDN89899.1 hypothetical protein BuS5_02867 [Desulfosarcina sp. BuS5]